MNHNSQRLSAASQTRRRRLIPFRPIAQSLFNERGCACRWTGAGLGYVHGSVRRSPWLGLFDDSPIQDNFPCPISATYQLVTQTNANGNVTAYTYDNMGRVYEQTSPTGAVTRDKYDARGNVLETKQYDLNSFPAPVGTWLETAQTFDGIDDSVNIGDMKFNTSTKMPVFNETDMPGNVKYDAGPFFTTYGPGN